MNANNQMALSCIKDALTSDRLSSNGEPLKVWPPPTNALIVKIFKRISRELWNTISIELYQLFYRRSHGTPLTIGPQIFEIWDEKALKHKRSACQKPPKNSCHSQLNWIWFWFVWFWVNLIVLWSTNRWRAIADAENLIVPNYYKWFCILVLPILLIIWRW